MYKRVQLRTYQIVEKAGIDDRASWCFDVFIQALILLNVTAVILETLPELDNHIRLFHRFEYYSVTVFTVEYLLRIWSCVVKDPYRHPLWGRIRFALTPMALIDLLAILPGILPLFFSPDMVVVRILRLFRFIRILKIARYTSALNTMRGVVTARSSELTLTFIVVMLMLVLASSLMYFAEHDAQPDKFTSIPEAMWWAIMTLSTVGYGDVVPVTAIGRLIAAVVSVLGIAFFAIPAGILGSGFVEQMQEEKAAPMRCPHCGHEIHLVQMVRETRRKG